MSRTLSWIDRIYPIAKAVASSSRTHYDRRDLQQLFGIQPRSAQNLMSALPTVSVGRANLVEREALSKFISQLQRADDPTETYGQLRAAKGTGEKRKLKGLVLQDVVADVDALPNAISLSPGEVRVQFRKVEELVEALMHLAIVLDKQLDTFIVRYEPVPDLNPKEQAEKDAERAEVDYLRNWNPHRTV